MAELTRDQVSQAVNDGAELVIHDDGLQVGERETDLINLVVNAAMTLLDKPGTTLDQVMDSNYEGGAARVRSWWGSWS